MRTSSLPLLLLLASGCTWVTPDQYKERLSKVDDDGDGDLAENDCDDLDGTIGPSQIETWYNGVDNDCDDRDDYDQDLDGYVANEYLGMATAGVDGTGALPGGDCDDLSPTTSPIQPDDWYDGLDQDCDGRDDFDQDGDGYVEDEYLDRPTTNAPGTGSLPGGECDDEVYGVNPGAVDAPYDGVDTDCGGNDDYDADGDNFVPTELYDEYGPTQYVTNSGLLPNGDCDDTDAGINPAASDTWYDGVDSDCGEDDDYDQDGDGFLSLQEATGGDDCDDEVASTWPGAPETLDDSADSDCNGTADSFALLAYDTYTWDGPVRPVFAEDSGYVYLSVAATEIVTDTSTSYYDSATALRLETADPMAGVNAALTWNSNTRDSYTLGDAHDFAADGGYLYGVVGVLTSTTRSFRIARYDVARGTRLGYPVQSPTLTAPYTDLDMVLDPADQTVHVVGCDDAGTLAYSHVDLATSDSLSNEEAAGITASACALSFQAGDQVVTSEDGGILVYDFDSTLDPPTFTGTTFTTSYFPLDLDVPESMASRWVVFADQSTGSVVALDTSLGATVLASRVHAVSVDTYEDADTGLLVVAWSDESGDAWLGWGDPAGTWTTTQLEVSFDVTEVAVWSSDGAVYVGAVGDTAVAVGVAWSG